MDIICPNITCGKTKTYSSLTFIARLVCWRLEDNSNSMFSKNSTKHKTNYLVSLLLPISTFVTKSFGHLFLFLC